MFLYQLHLPGHLQGPFLTRAPVTVKGDSIQREWVVVLVAQKPNSDLAHLLVVPQVRQLQEDAARLQAAYAGDKADDIQKRENEVLEAWKALLDACEGRRVRLVDTGDKFRFFSMVRDLMLWMEDVIRQIEAQEKPR